ncbi:RHS repeat-associated core domain-containing protein [Sulfuriferula thiophila]|uniref:RHS repeat-associated core domain-containing protein n=1 Tax=Sulfuriferula thiophila TaxID=1781211 RepID=UPI000F615E02|nr:RHS repeat-associated core domain-containing protein [Sulfuriferula thiophila]
MKEMLNQVRVNVLSIAIIPLIAFLSIFIVIESADAQVVQQDSSHIQIIEYLPSNASAWSSCQAFEAPFIAIGYSSSEWCHQGAGTGNNPVVEAGWFCTTYTPGVCYTEFYIGDYYWPTCPTGQTPDRETGVCGYSKKNSAPSACSEKQVYVGDPIHAAIGNLYEQEQDISYGALQLIRYYNSQTLNSGSLGINWTVSFGQKLYPQPLNLWLKADRPNGKSYSFTPAGGGWITDVDITDTLTQLTDSTGATTGWRYTVAADDSVETYDATGKLLSITDRNGKIQTLTYDTNNHLISVTDAMGRQLNFTYDASSRIATMTAPSGGIYHYAYDSYNNLSTVTYPDNTIKTYLYENASFPNALTGIVDENGNRFATYGYDSQGRANLSTHALGDGQVNLTYNSDGSTAVTDALGTSRTYNFTTVLGVVKSTGQTQPGGSGCAAAASALSYDANGNVASRTDFNGIVTTYTYDLTRNLETSRTEAAGTPQARTISTVWDTNFRLPDSITEPGRITRYTYDSHGNVTQYSIQDTASGGTTRSWATSYTYASTVPGAVLSKVVDGPRTDVTDLTTTNYYDPAATCNGTAPLGCRGQISSVTNALNQTTSITQYDANSQPLSLTDPNGLTTSLTYDLRQRLTSLTQGNLLTQYSYDPAGNLIQISLPSGQTIHYTYDAAHRLTDIQDGQSNHIHYTLDTMGNRTREDVYDPNGVNVATHSRSFDALNRLYQDIGAVNQTTTYQYDANGNLTNTTDALNHSTSYQYDALNRLIQATDPNLGTTTASYNPLDQLTQIADPRALNTSYSQDAFGDTTRIVSPDTGTTSYSYDSAGNLKTKVDAKNQTTSYSYDALNRITTATYQDGTQAIYTWDQGINGIGHLSQLIDSSGTTNYQYDAYGHLTSKTQGVDTLQYAYDATTGQLTQLTYPNGQTVSYNYTQGRISSLTVNTTPLLTNIQYQPFGTAKSWTWGNGKTYSRSFNSDGLLSSYPLYTTVKSLSYDTAGRITGISDPANPQTLAYDPLNRLTSYATPSANQSYQYDANGNRTQLMVGTTSYPYSISSTSNRLTSTAGPTAQTNSYDATGNLTADGTRTYSYDARGRMNQVSVPVNRRTTNVTRYSLNGQGQRTAKTSGSSTTRYVYDTAGHLIYETTGSSSTAYVYLDDTPVAVLPSATQIDYIYTDQLNSPRLITNTANTIVWRNDQTDPFSAGAANSNPSGQGTFTFNPRFPGQYYDTETGLHYNMARDYDPTTGRYVQSDPIGLAGGSDATYTYVNGNPVNLMDPLGLDSDSITPVYPEAILYPIVRYIKTISEIVSPQQSVTPTISDLVNKYPVIKQSKETTQCKGQGGFPQASSDFDKYTQGLTQKNYPGDIRSAEFPDGTKISVRPSSSGGAPTIQINPAEGPTVKIRY